MQEKSLITMWEVVDKAAPVLHRFLDAKAKILQLEKLSWYDLDAPYPQEGASIPYESAVSLIIEHFAESYQELGDFAKMAFAGEWIESENRPGKAPGGFCTPLPQNKESRIFMSYSGTMHNLLTLAHELGHAYHNHVCFELPEMAQNYPMSLAECASTTAELIVLDALIANSRTRQDRKRLLYEKVQRHSVFFLNIRARFIFEQMLISETKKVAAMASA
jgi:oligoendopeptidase F